MTLQNKMHSKKPISKEELDSRLALGKVTSELEKVKKDIAYVHASGDFGPTSAGSLPLESLTSAGLNADQIYAQANENLSQFLSLLSQYAFSPQRAKLFFKNNRITPLLTMLKSAKQDALALSVVNIFKDRVKQRNGGKIPTVKEKSGFFGKTVERPMKMEEIAAGFEVEIDLPSNEPRPLTIVGTQSSFLLYLSQSLLQNDEILDPTRRSSRKQLAQFLQMAGIINTKTDDLAEKQFLACLLTPDALQPRSISETEKLTKFSTLLKKGIKWLEDRKQ